MAVIVVRQLIAGAGTADGVEIDMFSCRLPLFENSGIGYQGTVLQVNHALCDRQKRDLLRENRKDLVAEPVEAEAADTAQDQVRTLQCLLQFLDLIIFDPVMQASLQGDMEIVLAKTVDDVPVQGGSDQSDLVAVFKSRECDGRVHLPCTYKCDNAHGFLLV